MGTGIDLFLDWENRIWVAIPLVPGILGFLIMRVVSGIYFI